MHRICMLWELSRLHRIGMFLRQDMQMHRQEMEQQIDTMLRSFVNHIDSQIERLDESVEKVWREGSEWEMVLKYLNACPDEEYEEYVRRAEKYLDYLPHKEQEKVKKQLQELISEASKKKTKSTIKEKICDFAK